MMDDKGVEKADLYNKYGYHQINRKPNFVLVEKPYQAETPTPTIMPDGRLRPTTKITIEISRIAFGIFAFLGFCLMIFGLYKLPSVWPFPVIPVGSIAVLSVVLYLIIMLKIYSVLDIIVEFLREILRRMDKDSGS